MGSGASAAAEEQRIENIEDLVITGAGIAAIIVTQAGVALGLARACSVKFSATWGEQFASVATAMIALNLLIGPPLFRIALTRVGEASSTEDNNRGVNVVIVDDKEDEEREEE